MPSLLFNIFNNSFIAFFIPSYIHVKKQGGSESAQNYATTIFFGCFLVFLIIGLIGAYVLPVAVIHFNKTLFIEPARIQTFFHFSTWAALFLAFNILCSFCATLLQAEHRYGYSFWPQFLIPAISIGTIFMTHSYLREASILVGMALGGGISFIVSYSLALKFKFIRIWPSQFSFEAIAKQIHQFGFLFITNILSAMILPIDQYMASRLGEGQLSVLTYGIRIPDGLSDVVAAGLGVAVFSHFSEWVAEEKHDHLKMALKKVFTYSTIFIIPFCLLLILFAEPLIRLAFERGAFHSTNTWEVSHIVRVYSFIIYFAINSAVISRVISAYKMNYILIYTGALTLVGKIFFNFLFISWFGLNGIPLATILCALMGWGVAYMVIQRALGQASFKERGSR